MRLAIDFTAIKPYIILLVTNDVSDAGAGFQATFTHGGDQGSMVAFVLVGVCLAEIGNGVLESGGFAHIAGKQHRVARAGMGAAGRGRITRRSS